MRLMRESSPIEGDEILRRTHAKYEILMRFYREIILYLRAIHV